ncbi:hypothetical protein Franean1_0268 [Parafrankia sp. EAN1pec]|uniref:hypothetical protein n=1 Tax=Parafrankia sp. (strain EAN1pec) TaxID=298653 RepID=UPI0000544565|nr:hypothetical protein Franean1_0268 [Frankia sp. EAN1pec]
MSAGRSGGRSGGFGGVDAADYATLRRRVRGFSADLDKELKKALKAAGDIGVQAVRQQIATVPASGSGRTSLRATVARNTRTQVRAKDVRVIQGARGITGKNARGLPRRLNQDAPFQHPVFGRGTVSQRPWRHFDKPIESKRAAMTAEAEAALKRAVDRIAE